MKQRIKQWAEEMVGRYPWLIVKFEFSCKYNTYLVSFSPYSDDEEFNRDALEFEDKMVDIYGDDAPLFTDDEKHFSLSENAQVICANSYSVFETLTLAVGLQSLGGWNKSKTPATTSHVDEGGDTLTYDDIQFEIAA